MLKRMIGENDRTHQSGFKWSSTTSRLTCLTQISEVGWGTFRDDSGKGNPRSVNFSANFLEEKNRKKIGKQNKFNPKEQNVIYHI